MLFQKILKKYFTFACINGKDNKIVAVKNGKEYKIWRVKSKFIINGSNNTIIVNYDKIKKVKNSFFKGLDIRINGDNNYVEIECPISFSDSYVQMNGNDNKFSIRTTPHSVYQARFNIAEQSEVNIGKSCEINNGDTWIVCNGNYKTPHKLTVGDNVFIAKDVVIRTSDGECMVNPETGEALSEPKDVYIGNNVWIMTRSMIVKGAKILDGSAVAPYSFVNKEFDEPNILLAGIPAKIKKHNIKWVPMSYRSYMQMKDSSLRPAP